MTDLTPTRRSSRQTKANIRYLGSDWDKEALRRLRAASESSGSSPNDSDINKESSDDEDFETAAAESAADDVSEDGDHSFGSNASNESLDVNESGDDGGGSERLWRVRKARSTIDAHRLPATKSTGVTTGLQPFLRQAADAMKLSLIYGPGDEDLAPIRHARDTWLRGRDATLPSKATLSDPKASFTFLQSEDATSTAGESEISFHGPTKGSHRQVVENGPVDAPDSMSLKKLLQGQVLNPITAGDAVSKGFLNNSMEHVVLSGPLTNQRPTSVGLRESQPLKASADVEQRDGWILNLGEKIQALSWAPKHGTAQFLAAVVRCTPLQREINGPSVPRSFGPAFTPSPGYPTAVQIWRFEATKAAEETLLGLDISQPPKLQQVIGLNSGDIREIKWAPVTTEPSASDSPILLAILSTDSHVRIIAVNLTDQPAATTYFEAVTPVIDIPPPSNPTSDFVITGEDPVFSTIAWLSAHELILGTSNGLAFSYDILEVLNQSSTSEQLTPYQTLSPHFTYITAIAPSVPIVPSTHRFIASSSAAGDLALDCVTPSHPASTVSSQRARLPSRLLTYSPYSRSWLTIYPPSAHSLSDPIADTNVPKAAPTSKKDQIGSGGPILVVHHLRRFTQLLQLARLPSSGGSATALAEASLHHPCLLMGNAGGEAWCTNYLRRAVAFRQHTRPRGGWILRVVRADWREDAVDGEATGRAKEQADLYHGPATRKGMTRLVFGWKAMPVELGTRPNEEGDKKSGKKNKKPIKKKAHKKGKMKAKSADEMLLDDDADGEADGEAGPEPPLLGADVEMAEDESVPAQDAWTDAAPINSHDNSTDPDNPDGETRRPSKIVVLKVPAGSANSTTSSKKKGKAKDSGPSTSAAQSRSTAAAEIVFEEEQAVTALAWSQVRETAGWAAVGWGSGLVMVRDFSV